MFGDTVVNLNQSTSVVDDMIAVKSVLSGAVLAVADVLFDS